jgi:NDP-sugar pyrophosphorylase family protein
MVADTMPPVVILAGGLARRMRPATHKVPKSLLPVAGEPFIAHQLRLLRRQRIDRVVLCLGYLGEQVQDFVGNGNQFGLEVTYSFDGDKLLGTGGAIVRALPQLSDVFFVLYGDSYLDIAYDSVVRAFRRSGAPALMTVYRNEGRWDTSNVLFDGARVVRYDKHAPSPEMCYIDYGLGILMRTALARWTAGSAFDLADVYGTLAAEGQLAGFEVQQRFYEIGTPEGLAETTEYLRSMG